jgi:hypothetical protein
MSTPTRTAGRTNGSVVLLLVPAAPNSDIALRTGCLGPQGRRLRQIVPDAALDDPVSVFAPGFLAIGRVVRMVRSAIRIAFESDRRYGDDRTCGKLLFQIVIFGLAFSQAQPTAKCRQFCASDFQNAASASTPRYRPYRVEREGPPEFSTLH